MLTPDQEKMREAAKAATPGKWIRTAGYSVVCEVPNVRNHGGYAVIDGSRYPAIANTSHGSLPGRDAEYIATANPAAILALLDQVEAQGWDVSYELMQGDEWVAGASGKDALKEIRHYAAVYSPDGPVEIVEVRRRTLPPPPEAA